jgi:hypothetical protein
VVEAEIDVYIWFCGDLKVAPQLAAIVEDVGVRFLDHLG